MPSRGGRHGEKVPCTYRAIAAALKKRETLPSTPLGNWMSLGDTMLGEVSQTQDGPCKLPLPSPKWLELLEGGYQGRGAGRKTGCSVGTELQCFEMHEF